MRVLIVKTSSLGDVIHTLPALSDAQRAYPDIMFDWVVEEPFQEIPTWHPAVDRVIPLALRRWRKNPWRAFQAEDILKFLKHFRQEKYDLIIDAQGLLKSAAVALLGRSSLRVGLSWASAREPLASLFYQKRVEVSWDQHAIVRTRTLFAKGLGYAMPSTMPAYGLDRHRFPPFLSPQPYYVFLHGTTWETKHWPEVCWIELAKIIAKTGHSIQLPWGSEGEFARAQRIAALVPQAMVIPHKLDLHEVAGILAGARGVVAVDTGLGHLAAALGVPTVSLYGPTAPQRSGTWGENQVHLSADLACAPCLHRVCAYKVDQSVGPPCLAGLTPLKVWEHLVRQVGDC